jgi:hypothetical protein
MKVITDISDLYQIPWFLPDANQEPIARGELIFPSFPLSVQEKEISNARRNVPISGSICLLHSLWKETVYVGEGGYSYWLIYFEGS